MAQFNTENSDYPQFFVDSVFKCVTLGPHGNTPVKTMSKKKTRASVAFEPEVIEYLDVLAKQLDRDRSWVINNLTRLYRRRVEEGKEQVELLNIPASVTASPLPLSGN